MLTATQETSGMATTMNERVLTASARYLRAVGYEIIEQGWEFPGGTFDFVARDEDGALVFFEVDFDLDADKAFPAFAADESVREKFELGAMRYIMHSDVLDVPVRFDRLHLKVAGTDRAMVRHHVNAIALGF